MFFLADRFDAETTGSHRPVHAYVFNTAADTARTVVARGADTSVSDLLTSLAKSRRGRRPYGTRRHSLSSMPTRSIRSRYSTPSLQH